jgi:hypothetical protein
MSDGNRRIAEEKRHAAPPRQASELPRAYCTQEHEGGRVMIFSRVGRIYRRTCIGP